MNRSDNSRRIKVLRETDSQKIAAGEVIDRPFSVIRELLDNSIDSGADSIEVSIAGGGLDEIRVTDNGSGMDEEDLRLCWLPHATSKIETAEDIYRVKTLGFRGEALSSMAAAGKLEITSKPGPSGISRKLTVSGGNFVSLIPFPGAVGTTVSLRELFHTMPGRKRFLKSTSAETAQCVTAFIEKALPFPSITFRMFVDGRLRHFLPAGGLSSRVAVAWGRKLTEGILSELSAEGERHSVTAVISDPGIRFPDRKLIQVFVNGRRIWDYSLTQAVEFGCAGQFPGGTFPACAVFFTLDPGEVDFNIHPAKREAKFRNPAELHRSLVSLLRSRFPSIEAKRPDYPSAWYGPGGGFGERAAGPAAAQYPYTQPGLAYRPAAPQLSETHAAEPGYRYHEPIPLHASSEFLDRIGEPPPDGFIYHGQIFNLFLLAERGDRFYMIDQHAAHERILYDEFSGRKNESQELLVPCLIEIDSEEEEILSARMAELSSVGIEVTREGPGEWQIRRIPVFAVDAVDEIVSYIREMRGSPENLQERLYASMACRKAVKDGEILDPLTAMELVRKTFLLPVPLCPHGRPVWHELSREDLLRLVGRVV